MDRRLIDYLPFHVRGYKEFQGITTGEQPEFELVWELAEEVMKNQFILTAEEMGLSRWEKILHLSPKPTDSFDIRRLRILAKLWTKIPYTFPWLKEWMGLVCGPDGHTETVNDYFLSIVLNANILENVTDIFWIVHETLVDATPVNLIIDIMRVWETTGTVYVGAFTGFKQVMEIWPDAVLGLESTGEDRATGLSSLKPRMEIYPDTVGKLEMTGESQSRGFPTMEEHMEIYPDSVSSMELTGEDRAAGLSQLEGQLDIYPATAERLELEGAVEAKSLTGTFPKIHVFPGAVTRLETTVEAENSGLTATRSTIEIYPE